MTEAAELADAAVAPLTSSEQRARRLLEEFHYDMDLDLRYDAGLIRRVWPYLRTHGALLTIALILIPITTFTTLLQPFLIKHVVDVVLRPAEVNPWLTHARMLLGVTAENLWEALMVTFALAVALEFAARFGQTYCMQLAGQRAMKDLRSDTFAHAQRMRTAYFDRTPVGRVLTRVTNDVDSLGELFSSGAVMAVGDILLLVGIVLFMLHLNWQLALVTLAALPPLAAAVEYIRRLARGAYREIRVRIAQLNAFLSEQVQGMQVVQAFGREETSAQEYAVINDAYRLANHRSIFFDAVLFSLVESVSFICIALMLWYMSVQAGWIASESGNVVEYIGTVVAFHLYISLFFLPIRDLSTKYTIIQSSLAAAERVFGFLDTNETEPEAGEPSKLAQPSAPGSVLFEGVSFAYKPGDDVLLDLNFEVRPGEHVAIVGATGAGKTTTISLLLRLYERRTGRILVDGIETAEMDLVQLRRRFSVVPQDVFLFTGSVAENVALDGSSDDARVRDALGRVGALDLIEARQGGIHARVEERGSNFSAGERQLIAFARALYHDGPILVLDEATANIDSETEARLQQAVRELMKGRTSIAIAHRLSTIQEADRILVFHHGRIVESGTHRELLQHGQVYAHLHRLQFGDN